MVYHGDSIIFYGHHHLHLLLRVTHHRHRWLMHAVFGCRFMGLFLHQDVDTMMFALRGWWVFWQEFQWVPWQSNMYQSNWSSIGHDCHAQAFVPLKIPKQNTQTLRDSTRLVRFSLSSTTSKGLHVTGNVCGSGNFMPLGLTGNIEKDLQLLWQHSKRPGSIFSPSFCWRDAGKLLLSAMSHDRSSFPLILVAEKCSSFVYWPRRFSFGESCNTWASLLTILDSGRYQQLGKSTKPPGWSKKTSI